MDTYEKKYNEALKWMRELYPGLHGATKEDAEHYFPELRESEEERIRKWLVNYFSSIKETVWLHMDITCEQILEYLEKQKEQKPAEWSEDWREEDIQTRFAFYTYKDDPSVLYLSNVFVEETSRNHGFGTRILKAAEKVAEAIGAITICLKVKQDSPANAWYRKRGYGYVAFEDGYDWLEKNLEYLKPAKPAEWSDEDEKMLNNIQDFLFENDNYITEVVIDAGVFKHWLKSLRPCTSWKPSEEQMRALNKVVNGEVLLTTQHESLESLYEQLKNLYKKDEKI